MIYTFKTAVYAIKLLSDNYFDFRYGFGAKASLPQT